MGLLSPGRYHEQVPRTREANLLYRRAVLRECRKSDTARQAAWEASRRDVLWYVNTFCWTFRPKAKVTEPRVVPFVTWPSQDRAFLYLVDHIERQREFAAEKSRDEGWSWICCLTADWHWRFHDWVKVGLFSRVGDLVDSRDPDSLFWKLRFIQQWLPEWLHPMGWTPRLHDLVMHRENPQTNSIITGSATTKDMGVAGRCTWAVFDEFSRVPNAREVLDNTKDTSDCRVFVSTHTGPGTAFHGLCTNGVTDKIVSHWTGHPDKARGKYRVNPAAPAGSRVEPLDPGYAYAPQCPHCRGPADAPVGMPSRCHQEPARPFEFVTDAGPTGGPFPYVRSPWYDEQARSRSRADVRTNLDIDVQGGTVEFFDAGVIEQLSRACTDPVEYDVHYDPDHGEPFALTPRPGGPLKLWVSPTGPCQLPPGKYGAGTDLSTGVNPNTGTNSVFSLMDASTGRKVAEYATPGMKPEAFAVLCVALCRCCDALLNWEEKGPGFAFGKTVQAIGYRKLFPRESWGTGRLKTFTGLYGWVPSQPAKRQLLDDYRAALENRYCVNPSALALRECLMYRYSPSKDGAVEHPRDVQMDDPSGAKSNHGDRVIADALAWLSCQRLGAALPGRPAPASAPGPEPGSFRWRELLHAEQSRRTRHDRPIRRR